MDSKKLNPVLNLNGYDGKAFIFMVNKEVYCDLYKPVKKGIGTKTVDQTFKNGRCDQ